MADGALIGMVGILKTDKIITIRHISVLPEWRQQGIGTLLLNDVKKRYAGNTIIAETDEESVEFYAKISFFCNSFKGQYGNLRYRCEFKVPPE